jgi:hypothetical protein
VSSIGHIFCGTKTKIVVELLNAVYELPNAEGESRVWRFARCPSPVKSRSFIASPTCASVFSLAQMCKELCKELLSQLLTKFEVDLDWLDVKYFLHTVCATFRKGKLLSVRAPESIAVLSSRTSAMRLRPRIVRHMLGSTTTRPRRLLHRVQCLYD